MLMYDHYQQKQKRMKMNKALYETARPIPRTSAESWLADQRTAALTEDGKQRRRNTWGAAAVAEQGTLPADYLKKEGFGLDPPPGDVDEPGTNLEPGDPEDNYS
jgi:hypothetical protein